MDGITRTSTKGIFSLLFMPNNNANGDAVEEIDFLIDINLRKTKTLLLSQNRAHFFFYLFSKQDRGLPRSGSSNNSLNQ